MLNVVSRDLNEKTRFIRERGYIPAVIYGTQLDRSIPISVYKTDFARMIDSGKNSGVLELNLNGDIKKWLVVQFKRWIFENICVSFNDQDPVIGRVLLQKYAMN